MKTYCSWFARLSGSSLAAIVLVGLCFNSRADCTATNVGITPLPDLGFGIYKNVEGGLYPNGANVRPSAHQAAGLLLAFSEIQPRDAAGNVETNNGKIVLLSIGMSNTTADWGNGFMPLANADPSKNPRLVLVDGAQGGQAATDWTNFNSVTWTNVENRLRNAGVSNTQVQVIWMKHARRNPNQAFPLHAQLLQDNMETILRVAQQRYPNLKMAYLSSRTRCYATNAGALNPEPFAYESGFSVRWLIEKQLNGNLNYIASNGPVVVPWLSWGPYLWADGTAPRSDGFTWLCSDLQNDFTHPSASGIGKVASELLAFFKTDPTTTPWFLKKTVNGQPPVCAPAADMERGLAPLTINFTANASDPDGTIRDYQWTFEDGTFSTNANPAKIFPTGGNYTARLTVTDSNGNTALGNVNITVASALLDNPVYAAGQFIFAVNGPTNRNHVVQASPNLANWVSLQTNRGPFTFTNAPITNAAARFYRALSMP